MNKPKVWTNERLKECIGYMESGLDDDAIALKMNRTATAIKYKRAEYIVNAIDSNHTVDTISAKTKMSKKDIDIAYKFGKEVRDITEQKTKIKSKPKKQPDAHDLDNNVANIYKLIKIKDYLEKNDNNNNLDKIKKLIDEKIDIMLNNNNNNNNNKLKYMEIIEGIETDDEI